MPAARIGVGATVLVAAGLLIAAVPYWTNGVPLATPPLTGAERLPADTYLAGSTAPQQEGISISQVQGYAISTPGTWTALQKFSSGDLAVLGGGTGYDYFTSGYAGASTFALALPAYAGGVVVTVTGAPAQGDLLYFNGATWIDLAPGTTAQVLTTKGASANPVWAAGMAVGTTIVSGGSSGNVEYNNGGVLGELGTVGPGTAVAMAADGTWTPADASGAGLVFTGAQGTYRTIGKMVCVDGQVTYPVTADASNAAISMPLTTAAGGGSRPSIALSSGAGAVLVGFIAVSSGNMAVYNASNTTLIPNNFLTGTTVYMSGCYRQQ